MDEWQIGVEQFEGGTHTLNTIGSLTVGDSLIERYKCNNDPSGLYLAISYYSNTQFNETDHLEQLFDELAKRIKAISDAAELEKEFVLIHKCLEDAEHSLTNRRTLIDNFILLLMKRYSDDTSPYIQASYYAVSHYRNELAKIATPDNDVFATISNFSIVLIKVHEEEDITPAAEDVIAIFRRVVSHFASNSNTERYNPLFDQLIWLLAIMPDQEYFDDTISDITQFMGLIPSSHEQRSLAFNALYRILLTRYRESDSEKLLSVLEIPEDPFDLFYELAESLQLRSKQLEGEGGPNEDLDGAILCLRAAIMLPAVGSERYARSKRLLGACLLDRCRRNNYNAEDLNEGIRHSMTHEKKPDEHLHSLAQRFEQLFDEEQDKEKLSDNIAQYQVVLLSQPLPHPDRTKTLQRLGTALASLFKISGEVTQLNNGILYLREAVLLAPKDGIILMALAHALLEKARLAKHFRFGQLAEIQSLIQESLTILPFGMGSMVETMFGLMKSTEYDAEIVRSNISNLRGYTPVTKNPFDAANEMAHRLRSFYTVTREIEDIDGSIFYARKALELCPEKYSKRATIFHNLAEALFTRFQHTGNVQDLDEAIQNYDQCLKALPGNHYHRAEYDVGYGIARARKLGLIYLSGETPESEMRPVFIDIIRQFKAVVLEATSSPIPYRFRAAMQWATILQRWRPESALTAYDQAMNFLPKLNSLGTKLHERQWSFIFNNTDGAGREAALNAIKVGKYNKAVEYLETGRASFWHQILQLRTPTDALRIAAPDLEAIFSRISAELEKATLEQEVRGAGSHAECLIREEQSVRIGELNEEWGQILNKIHDVKGFGDFLMPKDLSSLQKSIKNPVIYLIPHEHGSHALIMLSDDVKHVLLPNAPNQKLLDLMFQLPSRGQGQRGKRDSDESKALEQSKEANNKERGGRVSVHPSDLIKSVLKFLWNNVVSHIVSALALQKGTGTETRITWCPTGAFSFLPLHAAGIYKDDMSSVESTFDYFISSYMPTVGSLIRNAPSSSSGAQAPFRMMVVIDPKGLPHTVDEMNVIEKHISSKFLHKFGTQDSPAFVENVASSLSSVSIAHFACHGQQNTHYPLNSSLMLQDGDLTISRIMEKRVQNAALAFLCACETAMGAKALPDEAMHVGATLLFSGFRGVVATMWKISDDDGPVVADTFYSHLLKDKSQPVPNTELAAEAVHLAIAELRKRGVEFSRWVPFIYLGD
ncbi:CHAT domain-containing protein [Cyathus striatus]|nr:CHAT domain-containing protein [Cyathus striatus]